MLISSAGFMAIFALPMRLGELARPFYVSRERGARVSTLVGAVAVERIVDGLLISMLFFGGYLGSSGHVFSRQLAIAAWLSLGGFVTLAAFLYAAHIWTDRTIAITLRAPCFPGLPRPRPTKSTTSCAPSSPGSERSGTGATSPSFSSSPSPTGG